MAKLPRLLYIGDVPVEASYYGSLLLYRLLQNYPIANLRIIEGNLHPSAPERRLRGVQYQTLAVGYERLLRTRLHKFYSAILSLSAAGRAKQIEPLARNFSPEAVLTVAHGYSWITAATFAAKHQLPLHLICHDDWPRVADLPALAKRWLDSVFGKVYRQAVSRLCVSPWMREIYRELYGVEGEVLYPSRGSDCPSYDAPPERLANVSAPFTIAFAGTINYQGYIEALAILVKVLEQMSGRLLIFGPLKREDAERQGLARKSVELRGLLPSRELINQFRREVDALFVPMSFDERDRAHMESSFPSKLADYTAAGLPIIIRGPKYCSAVRWANENPGVADIVCSDDETALYDAIGRLANDSIRRMKIGQKALDSGRTYFAADIAGQVFQRALA
jgi:glycosyltransferase involved in cell wall biosynthesis